MLLRAFAFGFPFGDAFPLGVLPPALTLVFGEGAPLLPFAVAGRDELSLRAIGEAGRLATLRTIALSNFCAPLLASPHCGLPLRASRLAACDGEHSSFQKERHLLADCPLVARILRNRPNQFYCFGTNFPTLQLQ